VDTNNTTRSYKFNQYLTSILLCGEQKLCVVGDGKLSIYDISGKKAKLDYTIGNADEIMQDGNSIIAIRNKDVLNINPLTGTGFISYSLGDYELCGMQPDNNGYILCLIDNKSKKVALRIDENSNNSDSIDKKVANLQKYSEVSEISAYGKYIYVIPELGEPTFIPSLGNFGYNPNTVKNLDEILQKRISAVGISRSKYTIINTSLAGNN
jgi:hypothetical protein